MNTGCFIFAFKHEDTVSFLSLVALAKLFSPTHSTRWWWIVVLSVSILALLPVLRRGNTHSGSGILVWFDWVLGLISHKAAIHTLARGTAYSQSWHTFTEEFSVFSTSLLPCWWDSVLPRPLHWGPWFLAAQCWTYATVHSLPCDPPNGSLPTCQVVSIRTS